MKKVAIIMGSDSDWPVVKSACTVLKDFGIPFEAHILSAHRTPEAAADFAKSARANGYGVYPVRGRHGRPSGRCLCRQHHPAGGRHPDEGRCPGRPGRIACHRADAQRFSGGHRGAERRQKTPLTWPWPSLPWLMTTWPPSWTSSVRTPPPLSPKRTPPSPLRPPRCKTQKGVKAPTIFLHIVQKQGTMKVPATYYNNP